MQARCMLCFLSPIYHKSMNAQFLNNMQQETEEYPIKRGLLGLPRAQFGHQLSTLLRKSKTGLFSGNNTQ